MTGGTELTGKLNKTLASAAAKIGTGMGLGSGRIALEQTDTLNSFKVREELGPKMPFFANLGIAEIEKILAENNTQIITDLVASLDADGLIVHINPLQELLQPEGKCHIYSPLETIKSLLNKIDFPLIVKEVGQGFGPQSLQQLLTLPLEAIELAGHGGTNFSQVENLRSGTKHPSMQALTNVGHGVYEMIQWINSWVEKKEPNCKNIIISGGINSAIDGYYYNNLCKMPSIYGLASRLLPSAQTSLESLLDYLTFEIKSYSIAKKFLTLKEY